MGGGVPDARRSLCFLYRCGLTRNRIPCLDLSCGQWKYCPSPRGAAPCASLSGFARLARTPCRFCSCPSFFFKIFQINYKKSVSFRFLHIRGDSGVNIYNYSPCCYNPFVCSHHYAGYSRRSDLTCCQHNSHGCPSLRRSRLGRSSRSYWW
jgi:hypothetical protein